MRDNTKTQKTKVKEESSTKKEVIKMLVAVGIIFGATFGGYFIMQISLGTNMPMVVVVSPSMEPTIMTGDLLFVKGPVYADIINGTHPDRTGDIIIYDSNDVWALPVSDPIVHRCVGKNYSITEHKYYFQAWGDNNGAADEGGVWIPQENVLGVVVGRVPYIGYIKIWLTNSGMAIPIMVFLGLLLVISIVYDITHPEDESEKSKDKKSRDVKGQQQRLDSTEEENNQVPVEFKDKDLDLGV
jgi:signal peptidase I